MKILFFGLLILLINGCAIKDVSSWEKSKLAKENMSEEGANKSFSAFKEHTYFSKEGTRIGSTISGGGCGCN